MNDHSHDEALDLKGDHRSIGRREDAGVDPVRDSPDRMSYLVTAALLRWVFGDPARR